MSKNIPAGELERAVLNAVEQALGKKGAVSIERLWVGFVAPDAVATQHLANEVASKIGGPGATGSIGSVQFRPTAGSGGIQSDLIENLKIVGFIGPEVPGHGTAPGTVVK